MLPFLEVEHLPSSSSFYSAITQPLGLRYLSTDDGHFPSITYGHSLQSGPIFQIRQVVPSRDRPLRTSRIVLSAPTAAAADDTYEFALRANPDAGSSNPRHYPDSYAAASGASARRTTSSGGGIRVYITDFDGNMVQIVYSPPPEYPPHHTGSTVRYTRSTTQEAARILDWNYDVAVSSGSASGGSSRTASRRSYAKHPDDEAPGLRRSVTAGSSTYEPATSARENSSGLSAGAIAGIIGVAAAGAAFTYNMVKGHRDRGSRDDYDMPPFSRRYTYPEDYDPYPDRRARYIEVERAVDKVRYDTDYPPVSDYRRPPPDYIARYSQVGSTRSREADDLYDDARGRRAASRSRTSSVRHRSESGSHREPYIETEHRSYVSSRSSRHPPIVQRSYTYDTPLDRESYVSARSHRSSSTLRAAPSPPPPPTDHYVPHMSSRSRSNSRVTATTATAAYKTRDVPRSYSREGSYISAHRVPLPDSRAPSYIDPYDVPLPDSRATSYVHPRDVPLPDSRAPTYVAPYDVPLPASRAPTYLSARHVPLPPSRVGGSKWEGEDDDDDADSLAPSDSISCVGSRGRGR
ncbi:hypothetical protein VTK26DRAFT_1009 [Humicola hyalothermophila]